MGILEAVADATKALESEPNGHLSLGYRQQLLRSFGMPSGTRAHLALQCAEKVLPIWQGRWPQCGIPQEMLELGWNVLKSGKLPGDEFWSYWRRQNIHIAGA